VQASQQFFAALQCIFRAMLDNIVKKTKEVSYLTPEAKKQSKQRMEKGKPSPLRPEYMQAKLSRCCWF
jgi:hypothetical protein